MSIAAQIMIIVLAWVTAIAAFPIGIFLGVKFSECKLKPTMDRLAELELFLLPKKRMAFDHEDDYDGHWAEDPSDFEARYFERTVKSKKGQVTMRQRVLAELPVKDPVVRKEMRDLQAKGDGRWLGAYCERACHQPAQAKELADFRNRHASKGWELTAIEPAYDAGDGLFVWIELEKPVNLLQPDPNRMAA